MGISPAEVRLRRLLAATPQQGNQVKLLHYIAAMREQLALLTGENGHDDLPAIPASKAQQYAKSIDDLAGRIDTSACPLNIWEFLRSIRDDHKSSRLTNSIGKPALKLEKEEGGEEPLLRAKTQVSNLRRRRFERVEQQEEGRDEGGVVRLEFTTNQLVDKHRRIQQALIDDMATFLKQIKNNSLMMERSMKDTERVLDSTEEAVEHSLSATNRANLRAGAMYKSSWRTGCFTWLMLFLMCLIFIFMIGVIRITG